MTLSTPEMTEPETPSTASDQNFATYQTFFEANQVFEIQFKIKSELYKYKEVRQDYLANFKRLEKYLQNQNLPYLLQKRIIRAYLYLWEITKFFTTYKNDKTEYWGISFAQKEEELMVKYENGFCSSKKIENLEPMIKQANPLDINGRKAIRRNLFLHCTPSYDISSIFINFHILLDQISYEFRQINKDQYAICLLGKIRF